MSERVSESEGEITYGWKGAACLLDLERRWVDAEGIVLRLSRDWGGSLEIMLRSTVAA